MNLRGESSVAPLPWLLVRSTRGNSKLLAGEPILSTFPRIRCACVFSHLSVLFFALSCSQEAKRFGAAVSRDRTAIAKTRPGLFVGRVQPIPNYYLIGQTRIQEKKDNSRILPVCLASTRFYSPVTRSKKFATNSSIRNSNERERKR